MKHKPSKIDKRYLRQYYENEGKTFHHQSLMYSSETEYGYLNRFRLRILKKLILKLKPKNFLDVGCAEGLFVKIFENAGVNSFGIDFSFSKLKNSLTNNHHLVQGDAEYLPFKDKVVDILLLSEVLEHLPKPETALKEASRVATKNIIITVPLKKVTCNEQFDSPGLGHIWNYSEEVITKQIFDAELRIIKMFSFGHSESIKILGHIIRFLRILLIPQRLTRYLFDIVCLRLKFLRQRGHTLIIITGYK